MDKQLEEQISCLEAILFVADEPLSITIIKDLMDITTEQLQIILDLLAERYLRGGGLQLHLDDLGISLVTKTRYAEVIKRFKPDRKKRLSRASLETLSIIAYRQPVTRVEIEALRGVKCEKVLNRLLTIGLIRDVGHKDTLGKPILYGTTKAFLSHFGLRSIEDLPHPHDLKL